MRGWAASLIPFKVSNNQPHQSEGWGIVMLCIQAEYPCPQGPPVKCSWRRQESKTLHAWSSFAQMTPSSAIDYEVAKTRRYQQILSKGKGLWAVARWIMKEWHLGQFSMAKEQKGFSREVRMTLVVGEKSHSKQENQAWEHITQKRCMMSRQQQRWGRERRLVGVFHLEKLFLCRNFKILRNVQSVSLHISSNVFSLDNAIGSESEQLKINFLKVHH